MRRFFTTSLILLALSISAAGATPAAHAAGSIPAGNSCIAGQEDCADGLKCLIDANDNGYTCQNVGTTNTGAVDPASAHTPTDGDTQSGVIRKGLNAVIWAITSLFAWLVGVAALALNYAMYYTVVDMGGYVKHLSAIGTVWKILRDIGNILLIFGFLAIGISIIIDSEWYGGGQKLLPKLLIVAVFANFSLFAAEAMIDVGNLFATQIYKQINEGNLPNPSDTSATTGFAYVIQNKGVAGVLMNKLGLPSIYGEAKGVGADGKTLFAGNSPWYMGFMSIILFIVAAFVMFALAFILISRFIVLILLIMVSPVGIAGLVVPGLQGWANKWWDTLFHQTITAPILLLLLYIALSVIVDPGFLGFGTGSKPAWSGIETGNFIGFAGILLSYLIAMGLLLAVVYFAKTLSAVGAGWATKWAGRLSFGAAALGMSVPINSAARLVRYGVQRSGRDTAFRRSVSRGARFLENSRVDIRSIPGVGTGLTTAHADEAAKPIERGYFGRGRQVGEWWNRSSQESSRQFGQETRLPLLRREIAAGNVAAVRRILGNMSDKELETSQMQQILAHPVAAAALSQSRFDKLMTGEVLADAQKNNLRRQRNTGFIRQYTTLDGTIAGGRGPGADEYRNPPDHATAPNMPLPSVRHPGTNMTRAEQAVRALSSEAVSQLPDEVVSAPDVYENLNIKQFNAIQRADRIQDGTATTIGAFLSRDPIFIAYFNGRNRQQQQDINTFWHMNLPIAPADGGRQQGGGGGGDSPPPPGHRRNPDGNLFIPE